MFGETGRPGGRFQAYVSKLKLHKLYITAGVIYNTYSLCFNRELSLSPR